MAKQRAVIFLILITLIVTLAPINTFAEIQNFSSHGWSNPISSMTTSDLASFDNSLYTNKYSCRHAGMDLGIDDGKESPVYPIASGYVYYISRDPSPSGNQSFIAIRHITNDGTEFTAVYGHTYASSDIVVGKPVLANQILGYTRLFNSYHLHFGINENKDILTSGTLVKDFYGFGRVPVSTDPQTLGWRDPEIWLSQHAAPNSTATKQISICVDGQYIASEPAPFISSSRVFVPVRSLAEALKCTVSYDAPSKTVTIQKGTTNIVFSTIGKIIDVVKGLISKIINMDVLPIIKEGRVFLPVRFVGEALAAEVTWDSKSKTVFVTNTIDTSSTITPITEMAVGNGGELVQQGNWIYYTYDRLKKIKTDGTDKTAIIKGTTSAYCINVVGDWIYYIATGDIYIVSKDGLRNTCIMTFNSNYIHNMYVVGDWIYFINSITQANGTAADDIYKMRTDGSNLKQITDNTEVYEFHIQGDYIYYSQYENSYLLYKMKIDGSNSQKICSDNIIEFITADDWIYYRNASDKGKLYRIKIDGSGKQKINDEQSYNIQLFEDWLFYTVPVWESNNNICQFYKIRTDGSGRTKIYESKKSPIILSVMGDWVYYNESDYKCDAPTGHYKFSIMKMKTDGSAITEIESAFLEITEIMTDGS